MIIYPAIDLIDGQCVRLHKGDFDQKTIYDSNPVSMAQSFKGAGAEWLHVVDLDGAKNPNNRQTQLIASIIQQSGLKVQTGGGVRSEADVESLLDAGASRVVIGSLAVKEPDVVKKIVNRFGADKICLAADVLEKESVYYIAVSGWQEGSEVMLEDFLNDYQDIGIRHILCTDISKDGMMQGCNFDLYKNLNHKFENLCIQASGGVHALDDLTKLNTNGVIIGKALYEETFTLSEALEVVSC